MNPVQDSKQGAFGLNDRFGFSSGSLTDAYLKFKIIL